MIRKIQFTKSFDISTISGGTMIKLIKEFAKEHNTVPENISFKCRQIWLDVDEVASEVSLNFERWETPEETSEREKQNQRIAEQQDLAHLQNKSWQEKMELMEKFKAEQKSAKRSVRLAKKGLTEEDCERLRVAGMLTRKSH